jgi:hypothetical protein
MLRMGGVILLRLRTGLPPPPAEQRLHKAKRPRQLDARALLGLLVTVIAFCRPVLCAVGGRVPPRAGGLVPPRHGHAGDLALELLEHLAELDVTREDEVAALLLERGDRVLERDVELDALVHVLAQLAVLGDGAADVVQDLVAVVCKERGVVCGSSEGEEICFVWYSVLGIGAGDVIRDPLSAKRETE